jgi:23S rRNA (cytidine1920-2'-O)/16S rRNA (cytidine1409-2'-O)-methyltransferase
VIERITRGISAYNLQPRGVMESPLKGDKGGNTEFLAHFVHDPASGPLRLVPVDAASVVAVGEGGDDEQEQEGMGGVAGSGGAGSSISSGKATLV